jgi:hypothetical protein
MKSKRKVKEELHKLIDSIEDENALNILREDIIPYILKNRSGETGEELSDEQMKELEEALAEADKGETISFDEFKEQMDKWRTKLKSTKGSK